jgi:hypothetical protein
MKKNQSRSYLNHLVFWFCTALKERSWSSVVGIVARLWAGRSGILILVWARDFSLFQNVQTSCVTHTASYSVNTVVHFLGGGDWLVCEMELTTYLHLVLHLRMTGIVSLLSLYTFMAWTENL